MKPLPRTLPDAAYEGALAVLGTIGAGKTFMAKGALEPELARGAPAVILDPTGAWWGLRSSADGRQGGFPVVVLGGEHGDLPLADGAGAAVARLVAEKPLQLVLDLSEMSMGGRQRFATAFLEEAYRLNRRPLYLVLDEADLFAPQRPLPDQNVMLNRVENIVRRGRIRGFRCWLITQRPAELHKSVLSQAGTLVALKLTAPQDRNAIGDWIKGQADADAGRAVLADLPKLPRGEGYVWCPAADVLERRAFPPITTFDSSRSPEEGDAPAAPTRLAKVDLSALREALAPAPEAEAPPPPGKVRAAPAVDVAALEQAAEERGRAAGYAQGWSRATDRFREIWEDAAARVDVLLDRGQDPAPAAGSVGPAAARDPAPPAPPAPKPPAPAGPHTPPPPGVTGAQADLLRGLAWWAALGHASPLKAMLAAKVGWKVGGSHLRNRLGELASAGLITRQGDRISLTAAGMAAAPPPDLGQSLRASVDATLTGAQRQVFAVLLDELGPGEHPREALATRLGWELGGSHLRNRIGELTALAMVEQPARGVVRLADWLASPEGC